MKLLFICTGNLERSPTAEHLFKDRFETRSAGIVCDPATSHSIISRLFKKLKGQSADNPYISKPVTKELLEWADVIAVMEPWHREHLVNKFPKICRKKRILCLDIPDRYWRNDPELIKLLETKMKRVLPEERFNKTPTR